MKLKTAGPVKATAIPCCSQSINAGKQGAEERTNGNDRVINDVSGVLVSRFGVVESGDRVGHSVAEMLNETSEYGRKSRRNRHTTPAFPNPIPAKVEARLWHTCQSGFEAGKVK